MATPIVDIVFIQDWDNVESDPDENGDAPAWGDWDAMAEYLTRWDYGTETDNAHTMDDYTVSNNDDTHTVEIGGLTYTLTVNSHLRYAGLTRAPLEA